MISGDGDRLIQDSKSTVKNDLDLRDLLEPASLMGTKEDEPEKYDKDGEDSDAMSYGEDEFELPPRSGDTITDNSANSLDKENKGMNMTRMNSSLMRQLKT